MEFYFGAVDLEVFDSVDPLELFEHNNKYYWYKLELNEEGFNLLDTCGRMVPFDRDAANSFVSAAAIVQRYFGAFEESQNMLDRRMDQLNQLLEFWQNNE
jgi:hypothetical protein